MNAASAALRVDRTYRVSKGDATRQAILDRGFELATRIGLGGLSIGQLAEDLKLSKSGLFAHFRSKENLQIAVIQEAKRRFIDAVMVPSIREARGLPRVRQFFEEWMRWGARPGGCFFVQAASELDDQPGPVREALVQAQLDWLEALTHATHLCVEEGHFVAELDEDQFAFELYSLMLGAHHFLRFLQDPTAPIRARTTFEKLLASVSAERKPRQLGRGRSRK